MAFLGALFRGRGAASAATDANVNPHVWTHIRTQPTTQDTMGSVLTSETPPAASVPAGGWVHGLMPPQREMLTGGNAQAIVRELAFRGDSRSPDDIMAAGGMFPRGGTQWGTLAHGDAVDPGRHVGWGGDTPRTTAFVSCSRSYRVAKGFALGRYVYMLRVNNGVDISNFGTSGHSMQCEVCALFGVRFEDILGVKVVASGNVYRNTRFAAGGLSTQQMDAALDWLANGHAVQRV